MKSLLQSLVIGAAALALASAPAEAAYWISSTGKTHNSSCRYYETCKGYSSDTGSGDDCKICGGAGSSAKARRRAPKKKR